MTGYLVALARYHAARRTMARAERLLDRLLEHGVSEDRAWHSQACTFATGAASKPIKKCGGHGSG
jgi:hypothetical protein